MNPQQLPIVTIGTKYYFIDRRLRQLRNIAIPNDFIHFNDDAEIETFLHGHPNVAPNTDTAH
jgi:hypothetical protein